MSARRPGAATRRGRTPVRDRGLERHLGEVAQDPGGVLPVIGIVEAGVRREPVDPLGRLGAPPCLHHVGQLERSPHRLADPPHPLRVGVDDLDRPELVERSLRGRPRLERPLQHEEEVARHVPRQPVVEHRHGDVLDRRVDPERQRRGRRRADDRRLADQAQQVRHVPASGPLDVVGVDRAPGDRGDRVLELRRLVEPVRMERHGQVAGVGVAQDRVDQLGVRPVVLVDLEPHGACLHERVEVALVRRPGARLHAEVDRPGLEPRHDPLHRERRLLEPGGDERGDAGRERGRQQLRIDGVDVRVDDAGRRDGAVGRVGLGVRAHDEVDAVADRRAPGPADARDPAVLDADVGLHDADDGVDNDRAGEHDVELRRPRRAVPLGHARAEVLRVAPQRLVAARGPVLLPRGSTGPCRPAGRGRRSSGRSGCAAPRPTGGSRPVLLVAAGAAVADEPDDASSRPAPSPPRPPTAGRGGSPAPPRGPGRAAG